MEQKLLEIEEKVRSIINQYSNRKDNNSPVDIDENFSVFGINSVDFIKIIVGIETEFDFEFYDNDLEMDRFKNIRDLRDYILVRLQTKE